MGLQTSAKKNSMKTILFALFVSAVAMTQSPVPTTVQHAAETVAHLHDTMLDPASFALDGVYVTKANKRGNVSVCYAFRSHNAMGGYSAGRAVEDGDDHGRLSVLSEDNGAGRYQGYDVGWVAPCKDKNIDKEITAEVAALAPSLYRKSK
jgi:hypothetical protein